MNSKQIKKMGSEESLHIFMVTFPAQGHITPFLRLAKRLACSSLLVTLSAPHHVAQSIRTANNISDDSPSPLDRESIRFEFFDDGWGLEEPRRGDLDLYLGQLEVAGRENLIRMIREHEEKGRPVSCLIGNPFIPWVSDVAESLGVPSAMLWVQSCASFSAYYHFYHDLVLFPSENDPEIDVQLPFMPLLKHDEIPSFLHPSSRYPFLRRAILDQYKYLSKLFCILMDTFEELEHENVQHMSKICRPIKAVGPLCKEYLRNPPTSSNGTIRVDFFTADNSCAEFLDSKAEGTVVYISFGSVVYLSQEQVEEIAYGILSSGVSFLWVLKPPSRESGRLPHVLPEGFLEKSGDRGKIVQWSPQEEVLAHRSTACFVTHCGWNSTMEALASGVPVVAFPQWGDQVTDAKFLVDVFKVGIRLCRGAAEGRIVPREEVERCLREATGGGPEAAEMKENALKWKKAAAESVAEGGTSYRNMQEFVDEIVRIRGSRDQPTNS